MKLLFLFFILCINVFPQGFICAVGGGGEDYNSWSDAPYSWIVEKSDSGKILILSYDDATNWIPDYFKSLGAGEAKNFKIASRAAADLQSTYDELITAKAVFLKGGDQYKYIEYWKGTKTEEAINLIFKNGGVIAGTSAGLAVLGDLDFSAKNGSAVSEASLLNPFYSRIQLEDDFLDFVPDVIFDSHFIERGRFGRLIAMIFNAHFNLGKDVIGVGVDDRTAICIDNDGIGTVLGSGAAAIFYKDDKTSFVNDPSGYIINNLKCDQLTAGWQFDFNKREVSYIPPSAKEKINDEFKYPLTDLIVLGSSNIQTQVNVNLPSIIEQIAPENIVIFSHQNYAGKLVPVENYLNENHVSFQTIFLNSSIINDADAAGKIEKADCFFFAGDSIILFSLLNDQQSILSEKFLSKINSKTPAVLFGSSARTAGENYVDVNSDVYGSYRGKMKINPGINLFPELFLQEEIFEDSDLDENKVSAVLYGMMRMRKNFGVYINRSNLLRFNSEDKTITGSGNLPFIIVDARNTTYVDSSVFRAGGSVGPRQISAMNNLRYSISNNPDAVFSLIEGSFVNVSSVEETFVPAENYLNQNYPNPFNSQTNISFRLANASYTVIKIFDALGREVYTLLNDYLPAGNHLIKFDSSGKSLTSGTYFYRLYTDDFSAAGKMIYLK